MDKRKTYLEKYDAKSGLFRDGNEPYIILVDQEGNYYVEIDNKEYPFEQEDYRIYKSRQATQRSNLPYSSRDRLSPDQSNLLQLIPNFQWKFLYTLRYSKRTQNTHFYSRETNY